jgi:hypothetical protein
MFSLKNYFIIGIIFFISCGKENSQKIPESAPISEKDIVGEWEISPSPSGQRIYIINQYQANYSETYNGKKETFSIQPDGNGIRFLREGAESPVGFFLYTEKRGDRWEGVFQEELVRLIKVPSIPSTESQP